MGVLRMGLKRNLGYASAKTTAAMMEAAAKTFVLEAEAILANALILKPRSWCSEQQSRIDDYLAELLFVLWVKTPTIGDPEF